MRIIFYCQHVLGIGHFFRTLEICAKLKDHEVTLVTGGQRPTVSLPGHVKEFCLPSLMMDQNFETMFSTDGEEDLERIKDERKKALMHLFQKTQPDIFIVELYPFGRKAFRFELDPVLEEVRRGAFGPCQVICSIRDVLVEKKKVDDYETRVVSLLNRYFDAVLVHSDPQFLRLETTFSRLDEIEAPIVYTGFVTPKPEADAGLIMRAELNIDKDDYFIVASAGGGKVGHELLSAVVKAHGYLADGYHLHVFTGPFLDENHFSELKSFEKPRLRVDRFTKRFLTYLDAADLSVSMAGYNTSMNIMATGVPALVWPFSQNREQGLRAEKLARLGGMSILSDGDIDPKRMARLMTQIMAKKHATAGQIDLSGAEKTAVWVGGQGPAV